LRPVAVMEVPAGLRHRPGARPGRPGAAGPARDPRGVRRRAAVVREGPGADPDRDPGHRGGAGGDRRADDGEPAGTVRPRAPAGHRRRRHRRAGAAAAGLAVRGRRGAGRHVPAAPAGRRGAAAGALRAAGELGQHSHDEDGDEAGTGTGDGGVAEMSAPEQAEAGTPAGEPAADRVQEGGPAAERPRLVTPSDLADALLVIAEAFLAGKVATARDPEIYQVIVHVGTDVLPHSTPAPSTPATADPAPGDLAVSDPAGGTGGQPA